MQTDMFIVAENRSVVAWGQRWKKERFPRGIRKVLKVINNFAILIVVVISLVNVSELIKFKFVQLLSYNYASTNLFLNIGQKARQVTTLRNAQTVKNQVATALFLPITFYPCQKPTSVFFCVR